MGYEVRLQFKVETKNNLCANNSFHIHLKIIPHFKINHPASHKLTWIYILITITPQTGHVNFRNAEEFKVRNCHL